MIRDHRNLAAKRTTVKGPAGNSGNGNGNANAKPDPPAQPADSPSAPIPSTASSNPIPQSNSVPSPSSPSSDSNPTPLNSSPSPGSSSYDSSSILLSSGSSPIPSTSHPAPGSSAPSSSAPSSSAIPLPDSCLDCIITTDTNTSLQYNGVWFLNNISGSTTHSTTTPNSSVSFAFHGSGIAVFGTVPKSNATTKPPTAAYTVDTDPPFVTTEPSSDNDIPNQMLYRSSQLSSNEHVINITVESAGTPYIIQYIFVFPPNITQNTQMMSSSSPTSTPLKESEPNDQASDIRSLSEVLGGTLGAIFVFAIMVAAIIIIIRRRRRRRLLGHGKGSPTASWKPSFSASSRGLTSRASPAFTTTASIMRTNASSVSYDENI